MQANTLVPKDHFQKGSVNATSGQRLGAATLPALRTPAAMKNLS